MIIDGRTMIETVDNSVKEIIYEHYDPDDDSRAPLGIDQQNGSL